MSNAQSHPDKDKNEESVAEAAKSVAASGAEAAKAKAELEANKTANAARTEAEDVTRTVREEAEDRAARVQENVAGKADEEAARIREAGDAFGADSFANLAAEQVADNLSHAAHAIRDADFGSIQRDLTTFARRNPAVFFAGAAALGFLAGRMLKATGEDNDSEPSRERSVEFAHSGHGRPDAAPTPSTTTHARRPYDAWGYR